MNRFTKGFNLIAAVSRNRGIGFKNKIPWAFPSKDSTYFKKITCDSLNNKNNAIIMGKNTWKSLNNNVLRGRYNFVLSRTFEDNKHFASDNNSYFYTASSLDSALSIIDKRNDINEVFIIGGEQLYNQTITDKRCDKVYLTEIEEDYECDTFFPKLPKWMSLQKSDVDYCDKIDNYLTFNVFENIYNTQSFKHKVKDESKYLKLLDNIVKEDNHRQTRNAITLSSFGKHLEFDMKSGFPLLTTKKMYWRGVVEELLFFLKGNTDSNILANKKVNIWKPNTTREFLDNRNLQHYNEGDMGPMYGWNWRYFGAEYKGAEHDYSNQGLDQLKNCINLIKNDPTSRRIMMTSFDPSKLYQSVLAPCHSLMIQFYVNNNELSATMYQRSSDSFLGLPFNIASTSLLLHIIAHVTNKIPSKVHIFLGDVHVYDSHLDAINEQLKRIPYPKPMLQINKKNNENDSIDNILGFIEDLKYEDLKLLDYECHPSIKAEMIA